MKTFFLRLRSPWVWLLLIAMLGGWLYLERPANRSQPSYQTVEVQRGSLKATIGATGSVRARQSAVLTWQTSGKVENVFARLGDLVQKDQVLATLARDSLSQNILLAEADLTVAQRELEDLLHSNTATVQAWIALRDAQDAYDKAKRYYESLFHPYTYEVLTQRTVTFTIPSPSGPQTITRVVPSLKTVHIQEADEETKADAKADLDLKAARLEDAKRTYERLKDGPDAVQLASLQAKIAAAQATLNQARLLAPFTGIVTQANPLPGDLVSPGSVAFRIDDLSRLYIDLNISEMDINAVQQGQEVTISFDALPGKTYRGIVVQVGRVGVSAGEVVNFPVTVELSDADEQVRPGMTAAVTIFVREIQDALLIPNRAVRLVDGKYTVYVLRNGQVQPLTVHLGAGDESYSVLLSDTLQAGDLLVLNPPLQNTQAGPPPFVRGGRR